MPQLKVEISVYCADCGAGLCHLTTVKNDDIMVEPCPKCMEKYGDARREDGYEDGINFAKESE